MQITSSGYKIHIGAGALRALNAYLRKEKHSQYFILGDENTIKNCLPLLITGCKTLAKAEVFEVESGEVSKGLDICSQLWRTLIDYNADKNALIVNLGGGMICDLGGFLASLYKRGVDFVNVPTTLLAMADASVGGKNGVNLEGVKNVIGTVTQPKGVFISSEFLATLPAQHINNGLAEIYKIALVNDKALWKKLEGGKADLDDIITRSVQLKNAIVQKDPLEKNIRKALNFGHTIGHAIESASFESGEPLLHGEAILIGMICEAFIAHRKKLLSENELTAITLIFTMRFSLRKITRKEFDAVGKYVQNDKKNKNGKILFALPNHIGKCKIDVSADLEVVASSIDYYNSIANA